MVTGGWAGAVLKSGVRLFIRFACIYDAIRHDTAFAYAAAAAAGRGALRANATAAADNCETL